MSYSYHYAMNYNFEIADITNHFNAFYFIVCRGI